MIDKNKVKELANEWLEGKEYFLVDATVDEDNKITVEIAPSEAMDILYNSETYAKLKDPKTGLYFQSPAYIYGYLDKEIKQGSLATE